MTKKDYILLARAIRDSRDGTNDAAINLVSEKIADALARDRAVFNRQRFIDACK